MIRACVLKQGQGIVEFNTKQLGFVTIPVQATLQAEQSLTIKARVTDQQFNRKFSACIKLLKLFLLQRLLIRGQETAFNDQAVTDLVIGLGDKSIHPVRRTGLTINKNVEGLNRFSLRENFPKTNNKRLIFQG